jgi:multidrug efflux pump
VVSLTLTPMMCARLLRHVPESESPLPRGHGRFFDRVIALRPRAELGAGAPDATLLVAVGTLALTGLLYVVVPKGFFPVQDTGVIQASPRPRRPFVPAMGRKQEAGAEVMLRTRRWPACRRSSAWMAPTRRSTRAHADQPEAKGERDSMAVVTAGCRPRCRSWRHALYMQPVQDLTIEDRVAAPSTSSRRGPDPAVLAEWVPRWSSGCSRPELRDVASDLQNNGLRAYVEIDRDAAARFGITTAAIDNALYSAFGQRLISTIFTSPTSTAWCWRRCRSSGEPGALAALRLPSSSGGQVPLGRSRTSRSAPARS